MKQKGLQQSGTFDAFLLLISSGYVITLSAVSKIKIEKSLSLRANECTKFRLP